MEASRAALPKIMLKFASADSLSLKGRIEMHTLDLAIVFEDYLDARLSCANPSSASASIYVSREGPGAHGRPCYVRKRLGQFARCDQRAGHAQRRLRAMLDRVFSSLRGSLSPNMVAEADVFSSMLAAVRPEAWAAQSSLSARSRMCRAEPLVAVPIKSRSVPLHDRQRRMLS